jgi:hypothetical protein
VASDGPVCGTGGGSGTPVNTIRAAGLTLTETLSAAAPAVSCSVCLTFAGSFAVGPTRAEETTIDGFARAADGSARTTRTANASGRDMGELEHKPNFGVAS